MIQLVNNLYRQFAGVSMGLMTPEVAYNRHANAIIQALLLEVDVFIEERCIKKVIKKEESITKLEEATVAISRAGT